MAEPSEHRWLALFAAVTASFMTLLDVSIVNVALPTMGQGLHAQAAGLQWVVSGYALTFGVTPIIGGRLGDDYGRRRMLILGTSGFVLASAAVGFAPSIAVLIGARLVQGLAGGLLNPQVSGVIQELFDPAERGRGFGALGIVVGVATAAGPTVGGLLIAAGGEAWGWRLCFLVNLPIGLASIVLCHRLLPAAPARTGPRTHLDLTGASLLAAGLFGVLLPLVEYDADHNLWLALLFLPAGAVLAGFWFWERRPAHPLVDLTLFQKPSFAEGVRLALLYFVAYTGTPLVLSLFLQRGLGFSAAHAGLTATAFALGTALAAPIAGRLVPKLGRKLIVVALLLFMEGIGATALLAATLTGRLSSSAVAGLMMIGLFIGGLGGGSVIAPNQALSLADVDVREGSTAGGMLQTAQRLGSAAGTAVLSAVFYGSIAHGYALAYATALGLAVVFAAGALFVALRAVRADRLRASAQAGQGSR